MQFNKSQKIRFKTDIGAYSLVTDREFSDSQITLTDYEASVVLEYFKNENILRGNVRSNPELAKKPFKLYPNGNTIFLNIVFPKPKKGELRLYLSVNAGFKPNAGEIWFIFSKDSDLWIGSMGKNEWRNQFLIYKNDEIDDYYQNTIHSESEIKTTALKGRNIFVRDRKIALSRMEIVNYKCEFDSQHPLFISRASKLPYLEAHHLIPISYQDNFDHALDTIENVFCLCPFCHRAIHHAEEDFARQIIDSLLKKHSVLEKYNLTYNDVFSLYAVEELNIDR